MNTIAQKRRVVRLDNGSLQLQGREYVFSLDEQSKLPISFKEAMRMQSKQLVEEYMLMANILIAEHLSTIVKDKTLIRGHPDIPDDKKREL